MRDQGTLSNTSAVNINYSTLELDNTGVNGGLYNRSDRISTSATINLHGGTFFLEGAYGAATTQAVATTGGAAVNLADGESYISSFAGGNAATNASTSVLTIGNLVRNAANGATVTFNGLNLSGVPVEILTGTPTVN